MNSLIKKHFATGLITLQFVNEIKREQARRLRKAATPAEIKLWQYLRNRKFCGLKIRRQQVIDGFIADFYCEKIRLVIEVDGKYHESPAQKKYDEYREDVFKLRKIRTIRFKNEEVMDHLDVCLERLKVFI
jgi:very-short-patch-repair endonuclease